MNEHLIYVVSTSGHRQSYLDTLGPIFGLEPVSGQMSSTLFRRLVAAERLLFATLDDDVISFGAIAVMRSLLRRPTAALFLRAQKCFEIGRWYYPLKRHAFRAVCWLPRLTVASITPFDVAAPHPPGAHCGVVDPQYWDLHDGEILRQPGATGLSDEVQARAAGRHVVCVLGTLGVNKGLAFLAETLVRHPCIAERTLVVAAGRVPAEASSLAARMMGAGALIVNRFVTDAEIESLYGVADTIWACYTPHYDQASGVFGRAIQLGVPPIVREGSVIATFAATYSLGHFPVAYGDHEALAKLLERSPECRELASVLSQAKRLKLVGGWRRQFVETLGAKLSS